MKKILFGAIITINLFANEPIQYGAYYGEIKGDIKSTYNYAENDVSSAGSVYLYKNKIDVVNYIYDTKLKHIKSGLNAAKKYAIKKKMKYFSIDNISHQVISNDNKTIIMTSYNVLAFN